MSDKVYYVNMKPRAECAVGSVRSDHASEMVRDSINEICPINPLCSSGRHDPRNENQTNALKGPIFNLVGFWLE